jgi:hypothetical protein
VDEIVPTEEFPPVMPPACQETALLVDPVTFAVNCCAFPSWRVALAGETDTSTSEVRVTEAFAMSAEFAWETTVTVTVGGFGTAAGGL